MRTEQIPIDDHLIKEWMYGAISDLNDSANYPSNPTEIHVQIIVKYGNQEICLIKTLKEPEGPEF